MSSGKQDRFYLRTNKNIMHINRILTKTFLICLIYCLSILPASAQTSVLFSTDNQISSSLINDIYQDQKGFIWIATEYGLNLFDGNKFVTFHHIENDSTSLRNDYVFSVFEDSKNNLLPRLLPYTLFKLSNARMEKYGLHLLEEVYSKPTQKQNVATV